jgi:hypothetical protein
VTEPTKTPSKGAGKAAAAVAETKDEPRTVDFRGLTITLPAVLPGTLYFDMAALEDDSDSPAAVINLLGSLVGPDQIRAVREKVAEENIPFSEVETALWELFNAVLGAHAVTPGESPASDGS